MAYEFETDWFSANVPDWSRIFSEFLPAPRRIVEVGAYEGRSTIWMIENVLEKTEGHLVAIDAWKEGPEPDQKEMTAVGERFDRNIAFAMERYPSIRLEKMKHNSVSALSNLLARGDSGYFDFLYIDCNHRASDVLSDLIMAFHLCRVGGLIFCDDYLWHQHRGLVETPKLAIDAFTACFHFKIEIIPYCRLYQMYMRKIAE